MKQRIILSYSLQDEKLAQKVCQTIEKYGYNCQMTMGYFDNGMYYNIKSFEVVLLLYSKYSVLSFDFGEIAEQRGIDFIILKLDNTPIPRYFKRSIWFEDNDLDENIEERTIKLLHNIDSHCMRKIINSACAVAPTSSFNNMITDIDSNYSSIFKRYKKWWILLLFVTLLMTLVLLYR